MKKKLVIGLVGGMGSGKSRVAAALARRGARVVDGDALAHEALRQPAVRDKVASRWGPGVLDGRGEVQRRKLGAIVFGDPAERKALEEMVHPYLEGRLRSEVEGALADPSVPFVVVDAAIMLEAGWAGACDKLIFVDAPEEVRYRRLAEQRNWTAQEVQAREGAQLPLTWKRARADHVLDNSAGPENLERQIESLAHLWGLGPAGRG